MPRRRRQAGQPPGPDMIAALDPEDRREDMYLFSYRDAAPTMVAEFERRYLAEGQKPAILRHSRFLALPTIYLWRHFFELYLKKLNRRIACLADERVVFRGHRLHQLWADFRRMFLQVFPPEGNQLPRGFAEADELFQDLGVDDPDSQTARYARSRADEAHLANYDAINMTSFNRTCFFVIDALDGRDADMFGEELRRHRARGQTRARARTRR